MARSRLQWQIRSEDEPEGCMMGLVHLLGLRSEFKHQEQHNERVPFNLSLKKFIKSLRHSIGDDTINKEFKTNDAEKKRTLGYFLYEESGFHDENEAMPIKKASKTLADMFSLHECRSPEEESIQIKDYRESSVDESRVLKELPDVDEHVRFQLEAPGINYNEISDRSHQSCQMLEPILFEEIELSNKPLGEHNRLFDCINEVVEIHGMLYLHSPNAQTISTGQNFIQEVFEGIVPHLKLEFPSTLEKLITRDLDRTWLNLTFETQNVVCELGDDILVALIDELINVIHNYIILPITTVYGDEL